MFIPDFNLAVMYPPVISFARENMEHQTANLAIMYHTI